MAKSILQQRYLGIIAGTSIMAITALTIFAYLPHDTAIVFPKTSNILQHPSESHDKTQTVTYTEQNATILVALWITLIGYWKLPAVSHSLRSYLRRENNCLSQ